MKFNIPYYAQTSEFTCGPACILMVMKHFDPKLKLNRHLEFDVWRQSNMIGIRGADPYGLSIPLIDAGLEVRLATRWRRVISEKPWRNRLRRHYSHEEIQLSLFGARENQRRALKRHLPVQYKRPVVPDVVRGVQEGCASIALVHMGIVHHLNIPHWVVVTGADEQNVSFNDPYPPKGMRGLVLPHKKFQKILDDIGTRIGMSPSILFVREP
jgi:hypothetical protein